jgi:hypothetical protein
MIQDSRPTRTTAPLTCACCGRVLTMPAHTVAYVGVVGPECRHKFQPLIALVQQVEALRFDVHDQGSQRLAHDLAVKLGRLGFVVVKAGDVSRGQLWLEIDSRRVNKKGAQMIRDWKAAQEGIAALLETARRERDGVAA